jgi:helicase MOV-10
VVLKPGDSTTVKLLVKAKDRGVSNAHVVFRFQGFEIGRFVSVVFCGDPALHKTLGPIAPPAKQRKRRRRAENKNKIEEGERPLVTEKAAKKRMGNHPIPGKWKRASAVEKTGMLTELSVFDTSSDQLTDKYVDLYRSLLSTEELHLQMDMGQYDMDNAQLTKGSLYLQLPVPGLAEKRPSVLKGDHIFVTLPDEDVRYQGFIHQTERDSIHLKFSKKFHDKYDKQVCLVQFVFPRRTMCLLQQGLDLVRSTDAGAVSAALLFPCATTSTPRGHHRGHHRGHLPPLRA